MAQYNSVRRASARRNASLLKLAQIRKKTAEICSTTVTGTNVAVAVVIKSFHVFKIFNGLLLNVSTSFFGGFEGGMNMEIILL